MNVGRKGKARVIWATGARKISKITGMGMKSLMGHDSKAKGNQK
jgi:hypothetical protein